MTEPANYRRIGAAISEAIDPIIADQPVSDVVAALAELIWLTAYSSHTAPNDLRKAVMAVVDEAGEVISLRLG